MSDKTPVLSWGHININVSHLDESIAFYQKLGFSMLLPGIPYLDLTATDGFNKMPSAAARALAMQEQSEGRACIMQLDDGFPKIDLVEWSDANQQPPLGNADLGLVRFCLASQDLATDYAKLEKKLPPWSVLMILSGAKYFPEDKIVYEKEALFEVRNHVFPFTEILDVIPGYGSTNSLPELLRNPWPAGETYWKERFKGACQDLFFITTMEKAPVFVDTVRQIAAERGYDQREIGMYIQPIEFGAGAHVEFNLFYDPDNAEKIETVKQVYTESIKEALRLEAHFTRPYGKVTADLVYEKAASYTMLAKKTKEIIDPNNIMNPGTLCF